MQAFEVNNLNETIETVVESMVNDELVILTHDGAAVSLCIPIDSGLMEKGVHVNLAVHLFEKELLSLVNSANLAQMTIESFMELLASLDTPAVQYDACELEEELSHLAGRKPVADIVPHGKDSKDVQAAINGLLDNIVPEVSDEVLAELKNEGRAQ